MEFGKRIRDSSPGHAGKEGPHLAMTGAYGEFSQAAASVWGNTGGINWNLIVNYLLL